MRGPIFRPRGTLRFRRSAPTCFDGLIFCRAGRGRPRSPAAHKRTEAGAGQSSSLPLKIISFSLKRCLMGTSPALALKSISESSTVKTRCRGNTKIEVQRSAAGVHLNVHGVNGILTFHIQHCALRQSFLEIVCGPSAERKLADLNHVVRFFAFQKLFGLRARSRLPCDISPRPPPA